MNGTGHITSYARLGTVLAGLLLLTTITVTAARFDLGVWNLAIALAIASGKASLVLMEFMHLRSESRLLTGTFLLTVAILAVFIGFLFLDVAFR